MLSVRTYKAKKPAFREIENVHELCRLCLEKVEGGVQIFKDGQDVCAAVAVRIMICVGLEIKCEQFYPNTVCRVCYDELEKYYKFRRKCQLSHQQLRHHAQHMKTNQTKNVEIEAPLGTTEMPLVNMPVGMVEPWSVEEKQSEKTDQQEIPEDRQPLEISDNVTEKVTEMEVPIVVPESPDIGAFLSSVLCELGVVERRAGRLARRGAPALCLETGDGRRLLLDLVEEDDHTQLALDTPEGPALQKTEEPDATAVDVKSSNKSRAWCGRCARGFSSRSALRRHARAHGGARPHACTRCPASFAQKAVLQRHMLVHLAVRPFACPQCDKSFTQRGALAAHARAHRPPAARALALHRCLTCRAVFLHASGLSRHMVTHQGRVYECSSCQKHFKDRSSLTRHVRTVCRRGGEGGAPGAGDGASGEGATPAPEHSDHSRKTDTATGYSIEDMEAEH